MRAQRISSVAYGEEIELYIQDPVEGDQIVGIMPLTNVPSLVMDLHLALTGHRLERAGRTPAPAGPEQVLLRGEVVDKAG